MGKKAVKFEGVSEELHQILGAHMDQVGSRRRAREAFKDIQLSIDHILFKVPCDGLKMAESYEVNSRGLEIFSKSWVPESSSPKAVICFCHGYGDTCTFFFEGVARRLASSGYGVFAMDYPGFGLSEGLHGYIPKFDMLVDDVIEHYSKVKENPKYRMLPSFLFGESMGGAIALKVHLKQPDSWNGAILLAPMCKIADDMVPPWPATQILIGLAKLFPKLKLVPQKDFAKLAFRDVKKRQLVGVTSKTLLLFFTFYKKRKNNKKFFLDKILMIDIALFLIEAAYNVVAYKHKPRLRTALQLLRTTYEIDQQLEKISLPLLILHGKDDKVTDPSVSKALYEKASSLDKKLNLYDGAYHCLLEGEPDDVVLRVFGDIMSWLDQHC